MDQNAPHIPQGQPFEAPVAPRRTPDLHDPFINPIGRVDVLVARGLKLAVDSSRDPVLISWYSRFQPMLDTLFHARLRRYNCRKALENLGVVEPCVKRPRRKTRADVRDARNRREWMANMNEGGDCA